MTKWIQNLTILLIVLYSSQAFAGYKMSEYMEGDLPFTKWFGTTTATLRTRSYTQHNPTYLGYLNANWDMQELTGPNGGPDEDGNWVGIPFKHLNTWHMKTFTDGTVKEVGDTFISQGCTIKYSTGKEILWGTGNMNIGQLYDNQLHHTGCWQNWGWVDMRIVAHYPTFVIPAVSHGTWSCPATTFEDVIEIEHTQWFCENSNCSSQGENRFRYLFAKGFGAIQLWNNPGGLIIRAVCDESTSQCQCAANVLP